MQIYKNQINTDEIVSKQQGNLRADHLTLVEYLVYLWIISGFHLSIPRIPVDQSFLVFLKIQET